MARIPRFLFPACIVAAIALVGAAAPGGGPSWPSNVRVNQDHDGKNQGETSLAMDPNDPLHLVAVWWEVVSIDLQTGIAQNRINWAWTRDGGLTWQSRRLENGVYSTDPFIVADRGGNFYIETLLLPNYPTFDGVRIAILKSTDGGETFVKTADVGLDRFIAPSPRGVGGMDKPFLTIDPVTDALYLLWTDFAPRFPSGFRIFFAKSLDHGLTFSPARQISDPSGFGTFMTAAVGPAGEIYATWSTVWHSQRIWLNRSLDGGLTWLHNDLRVVDIPSGEWRQGTFLCWPVVAVDRSGGPHHGRVYLAWERYSLGFGRVDLAWSDDHGDHWSEPVRVDRFEDATDSDKAWVVVDDRGRVHVTYRLRRFALGGSLRAEYLATSTDGGVTFGPSIRISDDLYRYRPGGDYDQPVAVGNRLHAIWGDARLGDNDIFTQSIDLDDFDEDGIPNDGDSSGQYSDHPCTGGATTGCDDNCPGVPNADQADGDHDGIGDACDAA